MATEIRHKYTDPELDWLIRRKQREMAEQTRILDELIELRRARALERADAQSISHPDRPSSLRR